MSTLRRSPQGSPALAPFYSGAAHLVMLACVFVSMRPDVDRDRRGC